MTESQLIEKFKKREWEAMIEAANKLASKRTESANSFLKIQLASPDKFIRNATGLGIMEHPRKEYREMLIKQVLQLGTSENIGTLVFALENFDMSGHLDLICDWHFNGNAEVQMSTSSMLFGHTFRVTKDQLKRVRQLLTENKTSLENLGVDVVMKKE